MSVRTEGLPVDFPPSHGPVCLTGASGFLGTFVLERLLDAGYTVRATVRDPSNTRKMAPLEKLVESIGGSARERLSFFAADLTGNTEGFDTALTGCVACLHTACPVEVPFSTADKCYSSSREEAEATQIRPAVQGTETVLRACAKQGVSRVVLTSSEAAMCISPIPAEVLDEACWTDVEFASSKIGQLLPAPYVVAKTLQERRAWELAAEFGLDLRTINPVFILGPSHTPHSTVSHEVLRRIVMGDPAALPITKPATTPGTLQNFNFQFVDVREVAEAHLLALQRGSASGRYLMLEASMSLAEIAHFLLAPGGICPFPVEGADQEGFIPSKAHPFSTAKVRALGVQRVTAEDCLSASFAVLQQRGQVGVNGGA